MRIRELIIPCLLLFVLVSCENNRNDIKKGIEKFFSNDMENINEDYRVQYLNDILEIRNPLFTKNYKIKELTQLKDGSYTVKFMDHTDSLGFEYREGIVPSNSLVRFLIDNEKLFSKKLANKLYRNGEYDSLLRSFSATEDIDVIRIMVKVHRENNNYEGALNLYNKILIEDSSIVLEMHLVLSLMNRKNEALELLRSSVNKVPGVWAELGQYYDEQQGDFGYIFPKGYRPGIAKYYYLQGATEGEPEAMYRLGRYYRFVLDDLDSSYLWYVKGMGLGDIFCKSELADLILDSNYDSDLDPVELLLEVAVDRPDIGYYELGNIYDGGIGVEENDNMAIDFFKKAVKAGSTSAQIRLEYLEFEMKNINGSEI